MRGRWFQRGAGALLFLALAIAATMLLLGRKDGTAPISATHTQTTPAAAGPATVSEAPIGAGPSEGGPKRVDPSGPRRYRSLLAESSIVAFYGHPGGEALGVLGEDTPERIAARLKNQVAAYTAADPAFKVTPAFQIIFAVAQRHPQEDGSYLNRMTKEQLAPYFTVARQNGFLVILDIQIGRSTVEAEMEKLRPYLSDPIVHVAIDPEFAMPPGAIPGDLIGSVTAEQVNQAQAFLDPIVREYDLPNKILIVHEFVQGMIKGKERVLDYPGVDLVYDADGNGGQPGKRSLYDVLVANRHTRFAAIKLFYKHDTNLFEPQQVMNLRPKPTVIIYQ